MRSQRDSPKRFFRLDEANAMLPLVRAIVADLATLSREVIERRERLGQLLAGRDHVDRRDPYGSELAQIQEELRKDGERLRGYVEELRELGVEPKNGPEGLVDFPSLRDGRVVYLCWKLGEPEVRFWHELDAGFSGRRVVGEGRLADTASARGGGSDEGRSSLTD